MAKFPADKKRAPAAPPKQQQQRSSSSSQKTDRKPYLKADSMPEQYGVEMDVCIVEPIRIFTGGKFGDQLIVGVVTQDEKEFDWSFGIGKQQHLRLERRLGKDLTKWVGQVVPVTKDNYEGNDYVSVVEPK